ncbi:MAG: EI24 domain-containing protein [Pseudomonadota bacterium]
MHAVATAYGRALRSQFNGKILLMSIIPTLLSVALWGALLFFGWEPLLDTLQRMFTDYGWFQQAGSLLSRFGLGALKTVIVLVVAALLLLPLLILTSLVFMGVVAMPAISRHVSLRQFPALEKKHGGNLIGSLMASLTGFLVFVAVWLLSLPLYALFPLAVLVQIGLWGWLTARVMSYDALAEHASEDERATIVREHRWPLLVIGMVSGLAGAVPGVVWISLVWAALLFPLLAVISLWLYVLIFIFTGLWYQYYCLQALADLRARAGGKNVAPG